MDLHMQGKCWSIVREWIKGDVGQKLGNGSSDGREISIYIKLGNFINICKGNIDILYILLGNILYQHMQGKYWSAVICCFRGLVHSKSLDLKDQSNEIFDLQFFSSFEPALATDQWVKIFSNLVKNSQSYSNFKPKNLTPRGIILWRVNLPGVSYPCESISPGYHTPASHFFYTKVLISQRNLN